MKRVSVLIVRAHCFRYVSQSDVLASVLSWPASASPAPSYLTNVTLWFVCLFDFCFTALQHILGHFGRSVTLITLFLSKPPRQYLVYIISPVNENCSTWISGRGRMAVELFSWPSLHEIMCRTSGSNSGPLACQADTLPIELPHPAWSYGPNKVDKRQWSETDKSQFTSYLKHQKGKEYHHWGRHQEEKEKEKKEKEKKKKKKKKTTTKNKTKNKQKSKQCCV